MHMLLAPALLLPLAMPAADTPAVYRCTAPFGMNAFSLEVTKLGSWDGDYAVPAEAGTSPDLAGAGTLSLLDGGTSYEIVNGPLKDVLKARFLQPESDSVLFLDGPIPGPYRCEKST
jgi:hypothetical protein